MTADINFSDILTNPHFNQFVVLLRVTMSQHWHLRHPEVPSVRATLEYRLQKLSRILKDAPAIKRDFLAEWVALFVAIVEADPKLFYRPEDVEWFTGVLDSAHAMVILSMLFAAASMKQSYLTPVQVAEATKTAESTWRNKAAAHELIGAIKAGKQWLIPVATLRAYGYTIRSKAAQSLDESDLES